jgi:hypothetical protein
MEAPVEVSHHSFERQCRDGKNKEFRNRAHESREAAF